MINDPLERSKLLDLLRPPDGMTFDQGIGTTYSLDLTALLIAPLAFTWFDAEDEQGRVKLASLEVLESLRRYSERLSTFCQSGRILVPRTQVPQFAHLEKMVTQCAVDGGSFHPKVWVLRFVDEDGGVVYRVLCLTRNLTFDRSWDTALALEGPLLERRNGIARNRPLADFVEALPSFAIPPFNDAAANRARVLADELRRVDFAIPEGFDDLRFWPIGIANAPKHPLREGSRILVMSPFLSKSLVETAFRDRNRGILITTLSALADLPEWPEGLDDVFTLADSASPEPDEAESQEVFGHVATGLHAKCYVLDNGHRARVLTGSANATASGFGRNVEFLVELEGSRQKAGIDALLSGEQGATRLRDLLQPVSGPVEASPLDADAAAIEKLVDDAQAALSCATMRLQCGDEAGADGLYELGVLCESGLSLPAAVCVECWPITVRAEQAQTLLPSSVPAAAFRVSALSVSEFLAIRVVAGEGPARQAVEFVRRLPLTGGPANREDLVLRSLITDQKKFVKFLMLLLTGEGGNSPAPPDGPLDPTERGIGGWETGTSGLLETLLRALDQHPSRLDSVARLVGDLKASAGDAGLLPPGFEEVWQPIWDVRRRRQACQAQ